MRLPVSVLILTLNEECNIAACMDSVAWTDDIVVLDSFSTDRTGEIAREKGARFLRREFDNWSSHQNWAMTQIDFAYPWVFYLDADERCSKELAEEIGRMINGYSRYAAFRLRRRDYLMGKWLKHAQLYPTWLVRVFRPEKIRFERLVNPVPIVDGLVGKLEEDITHYPFSHGISHWVARHNKYSDMEALESQGTRVKKRIRISDVLSADPNRRRNALKQIFFRVPFRPFVKFIYYYVIRRGFLDGRAGVAYCLLQAFYEYLIVLKVEELRRREERLPI